MDSNVVNVEGGRSYATQGKNMNAGYSLTKTLPKG